MRRTLGWIVAGVVVYLFLDFGFFGLLFPSRVEVQETSITVADIKDIARLYTAKYYGETVNSLTEEMGGQKADEVMGLYRKLRELEGVDGRDNGTRLLDSFNRLQYPGKEGLFDILLEAYLNVFYRQEGAPDRDYSNLSPAEKRRFRAALLKAVLDMEPASFHREYYEDLKYEGARKLNLPEIAYIARGKVAAFIDLAKLTDRDFAIKGGDLTICAPLYIQSVINPLFVYGKDSFGHVVQYPGFMVVHNTRDAVGGDAPEYIKKVKLGCRLKLIRNALEDDFIKQARLSAERSLSNFISLFDKLEKVKITGVHVEIVSVTSDSQPVKEWFESRKDLLASAVPF